MYICNSLTNKPTRIMNKFFAGLIVLSLFSCKISEEKAVLSEIYKDFPESVELDFKTLDTINIESSDYHGLSIEDSILWHTISNHNIIGHCYNINTGKRISTIGTIGKAAYEFQEFPFLIFGKDSIQFYTSHKGLKIFSKKDILENKAMTERKFSIINIPDSTNLSHILKLEDGNIIGRFYSNIYETSRKLLDCNLNKGDVIIFNNKEAKSYNTIDYSSYENGLEEGNKEKGLVGMKDQIKFAFSNGSLCVKGSELAVFNAYEQFILYSFDIKKGKVIAEKRYTQINPQKPINAVGTTSDLGLILVSMASNDEHILYIARGYFSKEDKENKKIKTAILVFDWNLNPIKRYDLLKIDFKNTRLLLSKDGKSVYTGEFTEAGDGLLLHKADLGL